MKNRLAWQAALGASLIGALAASCGDDDDGADAGSGNPDSGVDAGASDLGVDGGVVDLCVDDTEGCECVSSAQPTSILIQRDTCPEGLLCMPWDLLTTRSNEFTGSFQSCVRPCQSNADCGQGRTCADSGLLGEEIGVRRFCVDRTVGVDNFCGFSRLLNPQHPSLRIETGSQMVGCADGHACQVAAFSGIHPSEGICFDTCQTDADCAAFSDTPMCNPRMFTQNSTTTPYIGVCSSRMGQPGDLCGSGPNSVSFLTSSCDTTNVPQNNAACLLLEDVLDPGFGLCWSICADPNNSDAVCPNDPTFGAQACIPDVLVNGAGLCDVECSTFGNDCTGSGTNGLGQVCSALVPTRLSQCVNRLEPSLTPGVVGVDGRLLSTGDICADPRPGTPGTSDIFRCPDPTSCTSIALDQAACMVGCETSTAASVLPCSEITGVVTSTCVVPDLPEQVRLPPGLGFCTGT